MASFFNFLQANGIMGRRHFCRQWAIVILLTVYVVLWIVSNNTLKLDADTKDTIDKQTDYIYVSVDSIHTNPFIQKDSTTDRTELKCMSRMQPPRPRVHHVSCKALMQRDRTEQLKPGQLRSSRHAKSDAAMVEYTSNCSKLLLSYRTCPNSEEEARYPIAFSILCHKDSAQVERLLRNIYQPQNVYCIHPDSKSNPDFHKALQNLADCFPNVFIASKLERVVYSSFSRLQADINCMQDLVNRPERWTYLINIVGAAFPLKTNREIVKILQVYNGQNDIEGLAADKFMQHRIGYIYSIKKTKRGETLRRGESRNRSVPGNLTLIRGSAYGVFSRAFLEFTLMDSLAKELLEWSMDTQTPDEHYWATLNQLYHNPFLNSPGGFKGRPENNTWVASYSKWQNYDRCGGKFIHYVCIFGIKDLPDLVSRHELFANKFYMDYEPLVVDCLEEWINNRTYEAPDFNLTFYENLPFVRENR